MNTLTAALMLTVVMSIAPSITAMQEARRPKPPALTTEDLLSPSTSPSPGEEVSKINKTTTSGSTIRSPRSFLENALTKIAAASSLRMRMLVSTPRGEMETVIERVQPDRFRIIGPDGEAIIVGRNLYSKSAGAGWRVTSTPARVSQATSFFNFGALVRQTLGASAVQIAGKILGEESIDGIDAITYEFTVNDPTGGGTIEVSVGKEDGYMRRLFVVAQKVELRVWFSNINEGLSIEPPI